jgi:hypothetical protein
VDEGVRVSKRRVAIGVVGTILLGAAGSALWEMIFKPGLTGSARAFASLTTLGSRRVSDWVYQSAALDPAAGASVGALFLFGYIPLWVAMGWIWADPLARITSRRYLLTFQSPRKRLNALKRIRQRWFWSLILAVCLLMTLPAAYLINRAVIARRVFVANVAILAPHITDAEYKRLYAQFSAMRSRSDYDNVERRLNELARVSRVKLVTPGPF